MKHYVEAFRCRHYVMCRENFRPVSPTEMIGWKWNKNHNFIKKLLFINKFAYICAR